MGRIVRRVGSGCKVRSRLQFRVVQVLVDVTITPYLSRDTTYCYRHCKGISHFPLLLYHPSPRPMPDQITSASQPSSFTSQRSYRTHASNPITCTASWTASFR